MIVAAELEIVLLALGLRDEDDKDEAALFFLDTPKVVCNGRSEGGVRCISLEQRWCV